LCYTILEAGISIVKMPMGSVYGKNPLSSSQTDVFSLYLQMMESDGTLCGSFYKGIDSSHEEFPYTNFEGTQIFIPFQV
jgi:hypothetical protein